MVVVFWADRHGATNSTLIKRQKRSFDTGVMMEWFPVAKTILAVLMRRGHGRVPGTSGRWRTSIGLPQGIECLTPEPCSSQSGIVIDSPDPGVLWRGPHRCAPIPPPKRSQVKGLKKLWRIGARGCDAQPCGNSYSSCSPISGLCRYREHIRLRTVTYDSGPGGP